VPYAVDVAIRQKGGVEVGSLLGLSTSSGMIALIVAMVAGVLATVLAMLFGLDGGPPIWIGVAGGVILPVALFAYIGSTILREQARFTALFPTPGADPVADHEE